MAIYKGNCGTIFTTKRVLSTDKDANSIFIRDLIGARTKRLITYYIGNFGILFRTCNSKREGDGGIEYCRPQWFCRHFDRAPTANQIRELISSTRYEF